MGKRINRRIYHGETSQSSNNTIYSFNVLVLILNCAESSGTAMMFQQLASLKAFELHKLVMHRLNLQTQSQDTRRTDADVIRDNHRFLWDDDREPEDWEERLAKKYFSKLFREYCICDLTRYKDKRVAMRWRVEQEVVTGKGQFICGSKHCSAKDHLQSWEVNFTYVEHGDKKNALVKLRLCPSCSKKLNYHSTKRLVKKQKRLKEKGIGRNSLSADSPSTTSKEESATVSIDPSDDSEIHGTTSIASKPLPETQWSDKAPIEERTREEEFGDYLEDLLL